MSNNMYKRLKSIIGILALLGFIINIFMFTKAGEIPKNTQYFWKFQMYTNITSLPFFACLSTWIYLSIFEFSFVKYKDILRRKKRLRAFIIACMIPIVIYIYYY